MKRLREESSLCFVSLGELRFPLEQEGEGLRTSWVLLMVNVEFQRVWSRGSRS